MDRRLKAGLLGMMIAGCAQARSGMPPSRLAPPGPVGQVDSFEPIAETINRAAPPGDPASRRAGLSAAPATLPPMPDASPVPAAAEAGPPPMPEGRPAPLADRMEGMPRVQAAPRNGRPEGEPEVARPSPFRDRAPAGPRPQSASPPGGPEPAPPTVAGPSPTPPAPTDDPAPEMPSPAAAVAPTTDPAVAQASATAPAPGPDPVAEVPVPAAASGQAATVGGEIITVHQVKVAMAEQREKVPPEQWRDPRVQKAVFDSTLTNLIERSLIIQAAKKKMKDPKALPTFFEAVDRAWAEHEMPPLLRKYGVANVHELKLELAKRGKSIDTIREDFRLDVLAHEFLMTAIQHKLTAPLPEKWKYYGDHLKDYDRPAQVVWREIEVDIKKCANRDEALRRATAIAARLAKGEDFAALARGESHGATARDGGKWETVPGGSAVPEINEALASLAPGRDSGVIEAPGGFHIVRVESRRDAGPARFDEVQDAIKAKILEEKRRKLTGAFLAQLREKTTITTIFDPPATEPEPDAGPDPQAVRAGGMAPPRP